MRSLKILSKQFIHSRRGRLRGDTLVEVIFAITAFSVVSLFTMNTMRVGIQQGEMSLEVSLARAEIAAQADAIRFIQNGFLAEREYSLSEQTYHKIWKRITEQIAVDGVPDLSASTCDTFYEGSTAPKKFIINLRELGASSSDAGKVVVNNANLFTQAPLYPRIIYGGSVASGEAESYLSEAPSPTTSIPTTISSAEGIWVTARRSEANAANASILANALNNAPEYYDFYIYSCWYSPGASNPTTIGTIIRLYNPELKEKIR